MTTVTEPRAGDFVPGDWVEAPAAPRRRIRGLRLKAVPSGSLVLQVAGGVAALAGVYVQWGLPVLLMVAGVAALALGTLREAEKI